MRASLILFIAICSIANLFVKQLSSVIEGIQADSQCIDTLKSIYQNNTISPLATNLLLYSSHGINDLGDYDSCSQSNVSTYYLLKMKFNPNFPSMVNFAFCGPSTCTIEDYNLLKPYIFNLVVNLLSANGIPLHTQTFDASIDRVVFTNPKEDMKITMKPSYGFYITIAIISVLLIVVIVSTMMERTGHKLKESSILGCWSAQSNLISLFNTKNPVDENLNCFNGLRFLMMCWIVIGHSFGDATIAPVPNYTDTIDAVQNNVWMTFITSASFTVDMFFAISGFLCAMSMTKSFSNPKNRNAKTIILAYLGRMLRLMPLVIFAILVFMFIMPLLFAGPINNFWDDYKDRCKRNFLYTIFFLNNFSGGENLCINPTWYLANDVQFYFLTPLFIIPYVLKRAVGLIVTISTIIISMIVQAILIAHYELSTSTFKEAKGNEFKIYYSKPYCRINTYLIGVLVAWIYLSYKDKAYQNKTFDKITDKFKNSRAFRYIGYIVAVPTMIALIMLNYFFDHYLDTTKLQNVLYMVLSRPLFIIAAFVVIYPVILGHGRGLFGILAAPFMAPLAKLTYGTYLIHVPILILEMLSTKRYIMFLSRYLFMRGLHLIFLAYTWSLIACLMIEAPMMKLEKILLFPKKAIPPPKATEDTEAPLTEKK